MISIFVANTQKPGYPVRKWEELCPREKEKYGNNEQRYIDELIIKGLYSQDPGDSISDCMKKTIDNYYDAKRYEHAKSLMETKFRRNSITIAAIAGLGKFGAIFGAPAGMMLAILGATQINAGLKAHDRSIAIDGIFNVGIGTLMGTAFLMPFPLSMSAFAVTIARELIYDPTMVSDLCARIKEKVKKQ